MRHACNAKVVKGNDVNNGILVQEFWREQLPKEHVRYITVNLKQLAYGLYESTGPTM